jgi:hypothetical protein
VLHDGWQMSSAHRPQRIASLRAAVALIVEATLPAATRVPIAHIGPIFSQFTQLTLELTR